MSKFGLGAWECRFCGKSQIATENNYHIRYNFFSIGETELGPIGMTLSAIRCLNRECNKASISCELNKSVFSDSRGQHVPTGTPIESWRLRPASFATQQPGFIPEPLRNDYYEACLIRDLSPKASATLSRRCLQGMIRDFCKISKARLIDEIKELRKLVDEDAGPKGVETETVDAIDHVRGVGNIGAHMEKDINNIVEVDPGEAQALIELIEMLFAEWYVAREKRRERLRKIETIALDKATQIADLRSQGQGVALSKEPESK
ncbi:DUF4145 domain-containing protein [Mesorhizobium sp. M0715]|uniref:DUF4145 domain-containing protein n=1 Tax=Mesorhizobium sp. M0715 TaxID=2956990 RepID=UPI00333A577F